MAVYPGRSIRRGAAVFAALLFLFPAAGCGAGSDSGAHDKKEAPAPSDITLLTIGTADSGGSMFAAGAAVAAQINIEDDSFRFNINASTGSLQNIEDLLEGRIDLALVSASAANDAVNGRGPFSGKRVEELRAVGALYTSVSNWMVLEDSDIRYVHDLKGMRAAVGPEGSATDLAGRTALRACGIDPSEEGFVNAGLGSGADRVADGTLDAVHGFAGVPVPGLLRLAGNAPCRLIGYTEDEIRAVLDENDAYTEVMIPAGSYPGQDLEVRSFGSKCILCVHLDMDEALAYRLAELLDKGRGPLSGSGELLSELAGDGFMTEGLPVPLHPGAERYFTQH